MLAEMTTLFPSLEILSSRPALNRQHEYVFHNSHENYWIRILKSEVSMREYTMLAALFKEVPHTPFPSNPITERWIRFLEGTGNSPVGNQSEIRAVHLKLQSAKVEELEDAVTAFFDENMQLVYISADQAVLIEQKSTYTQTIEDLASFLSALEADFFIKTKMYIGKFHTADDGYHTKFAKEAEWFLQGLSLLPNKRIFTMELLFPSFFIDQASQEMKEILHREILEPIGFDDSMLETVRSFFENGFNASVTSEKLHIHRNTLNYRLAKFQETTGISVRSFDGALVAYCASLLTSR
ncbi:hypothetical protein SLU01_07150 [Sporosarcina luteola]|uniref:PucR C-terminal helix-turn-helix domain-containing protein n=1 Tax=Sporosarcina luteola TaxID=582850 RepID=A0A511Z4M6_9BACL|nr:helix-turn-helix domain-containing protein [Sporosarcina luteola]GEN82403.1 hypothetical protein SLU01_07150 [Sporosarcina luteola]